MESIATCRTKFPNASSCVFDENLDFVSQSYPSYKARFVYLFFMDIRESKFHPNFGKRIRNITYSLKRKRSFRQKLSASFDFTTLIFSFERVLFDSFFKKIGHEPNSKQHWFHKDQSFLAKKLSFFGKIYSKSDDNLEQLLSYLESRAILIRKLSSIEFDKLFIQIVLDRTSPASKN